MKMMNPMQLLQTAPAASERTTVVQINLPQFTAPLSDLRVRGRAKEAPPRLNQTPHPRL